MPPTDTTTPNPANPGAEAAPVNMPAVSAPVNPEALPVTPINAVKQVETDVKEDTPAVEADAKTLSTKLDDLLSATEKSLKSSGSRELALVRTKIEEAKLWLDKLLQKKP